MLRIVDIDQASKPAAADADGTATPLSVEAQETANHQLYEDALELKLAGNIMAATAAYQRLLAQELIASADVHESATLEPSQPQRPALHLKFLALRNLAELHEKEGKLQSALDCLLVAVRLQDRDALVWQRLGSLAVRTGRPHLGRLALEQAVECSPHNQLAALRLRELLTSLGDRSALAQLHARSVRSLPHLAPHLTPPPPPSLSHVLALTPPSDDADADATVDTPADDADADVPRRPKRQRADHCPTLVVRLPEASWAAVASALVDTWRRLTTDTISTDTTFGGAAPDAGTYIRASLAAPPLPSLGRRISLVPPPPAAVVAPPPAPAAPPAEAVAVDDVEMIDGRGAPRVSLMIDAPAAPSVSAGDNTQIDAAPTLAPATASDASLSIVAAPEPETDPDHDEALGAAVAAAAIEEALQASGSHRVAASVSRKSSRVDPRKTSPLDVLACADRVVPGGPGLTYTVGGAEAGGVDAERVLREVEIDDAALNLTGPFLVCRRIALFRSGRVVAAAVFELHAAANVLEIPIFASSRAHRQQGNGSVLLALLVELAVRHLNAKVLVVSATNESRRFWLSMGLHVAAHCLSLIHI